MELPSLLISWPSGFWCLSIRDFVDLCSYLWQLPSMIGKDPWVLILGVCPLGPRLYIMILVEVQFHLFNKKFIKGSSEIYVYGWYTDEKDRTLLLMRSSQVVEWASRDVVPKTEQEKRIGFGLQSLVQGLASPFTSLWLWSRYLTSQKPLFSQLFKGG